MQIILVANLLGGINIRNLLKLSAIAVVAITLSSCSINAGSPKYTKTDCQAVNDKGSLKTVEIPSTKDIVNILCSDEFQGRLTGSEGNGKAGEYISKIFKDIGLSPMVNNGYYEKYSQDVFSLYGGDGKDSKTETVNNVVGIIKGSYSKKAVVISAHFDHIGYQQGKIVRGALDNASGVSALIKTAHILKEKSKKKPFDEDIIICAFNGEEEGLSGSRAFVKDVKSMYSSLYNINIDSIGAKEGGKNLALKNKSKVSDKLYEAIKSSFSKDNIGFSDVSVKGTSDHKSFEYTNIPNVFIVQENIEKLVHKSTDTPDILDYEKIDKIANAISDFVETNDGVVF